MVRWEEGERKEGEGGKRREEGVVRWEDEWREEEKGEERSGG